MDIQCFASNRTGQLIGADEGYWAFVPDPLPPRIDFNLQIFKLTSDADAELGHLNGLAAQMVEPGTLFYNFLRQEAVLSSKIEGTRTTVEGLALFEAAKSRDASRDELEVANYVEALKLGMDRCQELALRRVDCEPPIGYVLYFQSNKMLA